MTFKKKTVSTVVGLWSATALCSGLAYGADTLSRGEAISRALAAAPILGAMRESISAAKAGVLQADVKPNPRIDTTLENFTGTGPFTELGRTEFSVSYAQKYERGGKQKLRKRVAQEDKKITVAEWHIQRLDVIQQVENAYVTALASKARLENRQRQVALLADIKAAIEKRVVAGRDSDLSAQNAHVRLLTAENKANEAELMLDAAKLSLASLWQGDAESLVLEAGAFEQLPDAMTPRTPEMVQTGPDLVLWRLREDRRQASLALEKAKAVQDPTFRVGLRYHQDSGDVAAVAGVSLPLSIHDTNRGNIGRAKAELSRSRYESQEIERQLGRRLMMAHAAQSAAFIQARQLEGNLAAALEAKSLVMERLERGAASYLDVYTAQALVTEIEELRIEALAKFHAEQVSINRLTAKYNDSGLSPSGVNDASEDVTAGEGF